MGHITDDMVKQPAKKIKRAVKDLIPLIKQDNKRNGLIEGRKEVGIKDRD